MEASLLYRLHGHNQKQGVQVDPNRFREVFSSKYGKVRIFKILGVSEEVRLRSRGVEERRKTDVYEIKGRRVPPTLALLLTQSCSSSHHFPPRPLQSKTWVANPDNRDCDVPGGWFCRGVYPPALESVLANKKDFAQLEDFNAKRDEADAEAYQKAYMENMRDPKKAAAQAAKEAAKAEKKKKKGKEEKEEEADGVNRPPTKQELEALRDSLSDVWENTETTTRLWQLINDGDIDELQTWFQHVPAAAYARSSDGRGPMFWAFEQKNQDIVKLLMSVGVKTTDKDKDGKIPRDM